MMKRVFFYIILLFYFTKSLSTDIECSYGLESFWVTSSSYRCLVKHDPFINSTSKAFINSTIGLHETGKNNNNVLGFFAYHKTINYFPNGLDKIYANIETIVIETCHLREIHQTDVMVFPKLIAIGLRTNDIEVIEENLFQYNPLLKLVLIHANKVFHIDSNVFDHLTSLSYLGLDKNKCMSMYVDNGDSAKIQKVIAEIKSKCTNPQYKLLDGKLKTLEKEHKNFDTFENEVKAVETELISSAMYNVSIFAKRIQKLRDFQPSIIKYVQFKMNESYQNLSILKSAITLSIETAQNNMTKLLFDQKQTLTELAISNSKTLETLNSKIEKIEKTLSEFISIMSKQKEAAEKRSNLNQQNLYDTIKVQNYKIDKGTQFNDMAMSAFIIVCGLLGTMVIVIVYKKIIFRDY